MKDKKKISQSWVGSCASELKLKVNCLIKYSTSVLASLIMGEINQIPIIGTSKKKQNRWLFEGLIPKHKNWPI